VGASDLADCFINPCNLRRGFPGIYYRPDRVFSRHYNPHVLGRVNPCSGSVADWGPLSPVDRDGHLHTFSWVAETGQLNVVPLPYRVPINGDEFTKAAGRRWATSLDEGSSPQETGGEVLNTASFRAYGLLVQEVASDVRVFVAHPYWNAAEQCC